MSTKPGLHYNHGDDISARVVEPVAMTDLERSTLLRDYLAGHIFTSLNIDKDRVPHLVAEVFPVREVIDEIAQRRGRELGIPEGEYFSMAFGGVFEYRIRAHPSAVILHPDVTNPLPVFASCVVVNRADWEWFKTEVRKARDLAVESN